MQRPARERAGVRRRPPNRKQPNDSDERGHHLSRTDGVSSPMRASETAIRGAGVLRGSVSELAQSR